MTGEIEKKILALIKDEFGGPGTIGLNDDLFEFLRIDGDDCSDFMERFAAEFGVNMNNYLWYFHHGEEGWSFLKRPNEFVSSIPITLKLLIKPAQTGEWSLEYPEHSFPTSKWPEIGMLFIKIPLAIVFVSIGVVLLELLFLWVW